MFAALAVILLLGSASFAVAEEAIVEDLALVVTETPLYASLEIYAPVVSNVAKGTVAQLLAQRIDQYDVTWYQVSLKDGAKGWLTDAISLRISRAELKALLQKVTTDEFAEWRRLHAEEADERLETGMSELDLLLRRGLPIKKREVPGAVVWHYPHEEVVLNAGTITAIITNHSTKNDFILNFKAAGNTKLSIVTAEEPIAKKFSVQRTGRYRFSTLWQGMSNASASVSYRLTADGIEVAEFRANQRLHAGKRVSLGEVDLESEVEYQLEINCSGNGICSAGSIWGEYQYTK